MHLCVQSCTGDGGEYSVAAFWTLRGSPERQGEIFICTPTPTVLREPLPDFGLILSSGDPRLADEQVQGLWLCHHDQLRGGSCRHSGSKTQSFFL